MSIAGAFDVHRRRLTLGYPGTVTGELRDGRVALADREHLRQWLTRFAGHGGEAGFALEGCTGWRCVVGELVAAGVGPHLAEPAGTAALRGRKRHARTGRTGTRHLRVHLLAGGLPGSWIPPEHVLEARAAARLYKDLLDERGAWHQRIAATLFHQGAPAIGGMATPGGRAAAAEADLSPAGRPGPGCARPAGSPPELDPLRRQLNMLSRRQPGCRALRATQFGVGPVTSVAIWAELGDVRRLASSGDAVRHTGLDITVYSSDSSRPAGHLSRQGPELLRRARYESASCATRPAAPGYRYHTLRDLAPAGRPREPERCRPESPIHRLANLMRCARDKRTRVTNAASKTPPAPAGSATSTGIAGALARSPVLLSIPSAIVPGPGA